MSGLVSKGVSPDREKLINEFLQEYVMRVNKKRTKQLMAMTESAFECFKLSVRVSRCCRTLDLDKAYQFYKETKALISPEVLSNESTYSNLLSLVAGLGEQGSGQAIVRMTEPPHNIEAAVVVYKDMKANNIHCNESNYSAMIRCYSINNRSAEALEVYNELISACETDKAEAEKASCEDNEVKQKKPMVPKLRSFSPLLAALGRNGDVRRCKDIWHAMTEVCNIPPTEKEYTIMLRLSVTVKDKTLFYETFEAFKEDIPQPSTVELTDTLTDFFQTVESGFIVAHSLITSTGLIEFNGERLLSIDMEPETRQQLLSQLDTFAVMRDEVNRKFKPNNKIKELIQQKKAEKAAAVTASNSSGSSSKNNNRNPEAEDAVRQVKWDQFKSFLGQRQFDVIVDGANVGYYKQNYAGAPPHVDYAQNDQMVRHLITLGRKPLLILHCRHLNEHMVPNNPAVKALIEQWRVEGFMYDTPKGFNDDWFWLYVAVAYQCKVVTNDEMRDHHFQMLGPRWFSRWKERNQVHFDFTHCPRIYSFNTLQNLTNEDGKVRDTAEVVIDAPSSSEAVGNTNSGSDGKSRFKVVNKTITMHWPAPYSHRVQHIVSSRYEGYYIPPPPPKNSSSGNGSENGSERSEDQNEGDSGVDDTEGDNDVEQQAEGEEEDEVEEQGESSELWCLFYRPIGDNRGVDSSNSAKRDRTDSDTKTSDLLYTSKQPKS